jgi:hypothetical protein
MVAPVLVEKVAILSATPTKTAVSDGDFSGFS